MNKTGNPDSKNALDQALRESEKQFRDLANSIDEVFFALDKDLNYTYWNEACGRLFGLAPESMIGRSYYDLEFNRGYEWMADIYKEVMHTGRSQSFESDFHLGDQTFWYEVKAYPSQSGCSVLVRDITKRREAEEVLRENAERYRVFIEDSPAPVWHYELRPPLPLDLPVEEQIEWVLNKSVLVEANQAAAEQMGASSIDELLGMTLLETWGGDVDTGKRVVGDFIAQGHSLRMYETPETNVQGKRIWSIHNASSVIEDGHLARFWGTSNNITERKMAEEELRKSEKRYRTLADAAFEGIGISENGRVVDASSQLLEMLGYTREGLLGKPVSELVAPGSREFVKQQMAKGVDEAYEHRAQRKDGGVFPVVVRGRTIPYGEGKARVTVIRDITERKETEESIRASEEKFSKLFQTSPNALVISSLKDGRILDINEAGVLALGVQKKELVGRLSTEIGLVTGQDRRKLLGLLKRDGMYSGVELEVTLPNKEKRTGLFHGQIITINETKYLFQTIIDITDRKQMEDALSESEKRFRKIIESSPNSIAVTDLNGKILDCNEETLRIHGFTSKEELIGRSCFDFVSKSDVKRAKKNFQRAIDLGALKNIEYELLKKNGDIFPGEVSGSVMKSAGGDQIAGILITRDITERKKAEKELQESEEKIRNILESSPNAITVADLNGVITDCNDETLRIHGFKSKEDIIGMNAFALISEDDHERAMLNMERTLKEGSIRNVEYKLVRKDGEEFPGELSGSVMHDVYGNPSAFVAITRDITERKHTETLLKESSGRLHLALQAARMGTWEWDLDMNSVKWSTETLKIFGTDAEDFGGTYEAYLDFAAPGIRDQVDEGVKGFLDNARESSVIQYEHEIIRGDGKPGWIEVRGTTFLDEDGQPVRMTGICMDITEKKLAEAALRESEEKYRSFFETARDGAFVTTVDGKFLDCNHGFVELFGFNSKRELMKQPAANLYANPDDRNGLIEKVIQKGFIAHLPFKGRKKDGTILHALMTAVARSDEEGKVIGFHGSITDITERRKAEDRLLQKDYIIESSSSAIATSDLNGEMTFGNPAFLEMWGFDDPEEFMGKPFNEYWMIADRLDEIMDILLNEGVWSEEIQARRKDGSLFDVQVSAALVRDKEENPVSLMSSSVDITKRKRAEEALTESEEQYRSFFETARDGAFVTCIDNKFVDCNQGFVELFGFKSKSELMKQPVEDLYANPADRKELIEKVIQKGFIAHLPFKGRKKDGTILHALMTAVVRSDDNGNVTGFHGTITDITKRKQAVEALRESEEKLRLMFDSVAEGITIADLEGTITQANQATARIHGFARPEEMVGLNAFAFVAEKDQPRAQANTARVFEPGYREIVEYTLLRNDGTEFPGELAVSVARNESGEPMGFVAITRDITGRKQQEESIQRSRERALQQRASITSLVFDDAINSGDIQTAVRRLTEEVSAAIKVERVGVWLLSENGEEMHCIEQYEASNKKHSKGAVQITKNYPLYWKTIHTESQINADNAQNDPRTSEFKEDLLIPLGISSMLDVGIQVEGELIGVLCQEHIGEKRTWFPDEQAFVSTAASLVAQTITNAERKQAEKALREGEQRFRSLVENIPGVSYRCACDKDWTMKFISQEIGNLSGYPASDFIDNRIRTFTSVIHPDDRDMVERAVLTAVEAGEPFVMEYRILRADGAIRWVYERGRGVMDEHGEVGWLDGVILDITERKKAERALHYERDFNKKLIDTASAFFAVINDEGKIVMMNKLMLDTLGYSAEEVVGKEYRSLFVPEADQEITGQTFETLIANKKRTLNENHVLAKDGRELLVEWHGCPITNLDGEIREFFGVGIDITERKKAEAALQESEKRYRLLVENLPSVVWVTDPSGKTVFISHNVEDIYGFTAGEILGGGEEYWFGRIHPDDLEKVKEAFHGLLAHGKRFDVEYRIRRKDGEWIWLHDQADVVEEIDGLPHVYGVFSDITKRKLAEQETLNVFELSSDLLAIMNTETLVMTKVNPAFERTLGYSQEEFLSRPFPEFFHPRHRDRPRAQLMEAQEKGEHIFYSEDLMICQDGSQKWVGWVVNFLPEEKRAYGVGRNVTERKKAQEELMRRLMRFRLEEGNVYLVKETTPDSSLEAFKDLLSVGYDGLVLSRTPEAKFRESLEGDFGFLWLAEREGEGAVSPEPGAIRQRLEDLPWKEAVFMDRLDYLVFKKGFDSFLSFVQDIRELIYLKDSIVILSIDPATLEEREMSLLEKECLPLSPLHETTLPQQLFDILKFVYKQNSMKVLATYKSIGQEFSISRPTAMKRVGSLVYRGYLSEAKRGKEKTFELTEKGRNLFAK